jgi:hypothetical protein
MLCVETPITRGPDRSSIASAFINPIPVLYRTSVALYHVSSSKPATLCVSPHANVDILCNAEKPPSPQNVDLIMFSQECKAVLVLMHPVRIDQQQETCIYFSYLIFKS